MKLNFMNNELLGVKGNKDHPRNRGYLCPKGKAIVEMFNSPERLRHPLKKTENNQWQEISWEEAIKIIVDKLSIIKKHSGPQSVLIHVGQAGVDKQFTPYAELFANLFGTPNFSTAGSHCHLSRVIASSYTFACHPEPDFANSSCIILWGNNPASSKPTVLNMINQSRRKGGQLIVIDPRTTSLAAKADLHLRVRPGTDGALALGLINYILQKGLYHHDFVEKWTIGIERLKDLTREFTLEKAESITGVPGSNIEQAAQIYSNSTSACIADGNSLELQSNGFQTVRAISILQAITGNLDIKGGALFTQAFLSPLEMKNNALGMPAIGQNDYPLFFKYSGNAQANRYADAILSSVPYEIQAMIVMGSNPLLTWPNAGKLRQALEKLEFLIVMDHFMTETGRMADLVLPAGTFLSSYELWEDFDSEGRLIVGLAEPVIDEGECRSNWWFWKALAEEMGYAADYPWQNESEALDARLKQKGLSLEQLKKFPIGYVYGKWEERKYLKNGFATPSGKVEIFSNELEKFGHEPLPFYSPPVESRESSPEIAQKYPFILSSGARTREYMHSRFHNLHSLRKLCPEPLLEINPFIAADLGIEEGDMVRVESRRGKLLIKAQYNPDLDTEVILMPHGWDEANANLLTDNDDLDPISGFPASRAVLVRISKA
jgi:anaerobic selenocysteine-containing dehydrogenase